MRYFGIPLRSVSQEVLKISILDWSLKITHFRLQPHLTGKWNVEGFSRELYVDGNDLECEGAVELIRLVADNAALEAFEREEAARRKREEEEAMLRGRESLAHLEFAPKCTIDNKAALIQVMAPGGGGGGYSLCESQ